VRRWGLERLVEQIARFTRSGVGRLVCAVLALPLIGVVAAFTLPGRTTHAAAIAGAPRTVTGGAGASAPSAGSKTAAGAPRSGASVAAGGAAAAGNVVVAPSGRTVDVFAPKTTSTGRTYKPAHLYSGADAFQGITASTINICMHAAISLGPAFNETASDVSTYFRYLNAHGGVIGRQVNFTIEDDKYTAQGAQIAAQQCEGTKPFFVLGGVGFDQDPIVRSIAEQDHFIYIYTMADDGSQGHGAPKSYKYSFTAAPTIEQVGTWMGQTAVHNDPGPYGAVYVNDQNWVGGYNTFRAYLDAHGGGSVDHDSYTMGSGADNSQFNSDIAQLQLHGVKTVFLWMNALGADEFIATASNQGYHPAYVTPDGFDLVTGTVGQDIDDHSGSIRPALGGWITPAFDPKNPSVPYWPYEKQLLDAYNAYDNGHQPDDIDWQAWLAFRSVTDMLKLCGTDCNRNDIAGLFESGLSASTPPLCNADFTQNHNFGGRYMNLWRAVRVPYISPDYPSASQHTVWKQITTCASKFD
jgi:ABC-type branched-subunit amino acid transport system substrate-binding protein